MKAEDRKIKEDKAGENREDGRTGLEEQRKQGVTKNRV